MMKRQGWRLLLTGVLLLTGILYSCEKEDPEMENLGQNTGIVGTWVQDIQDADRLWLTRSDALDPDKYGFTLKGDGDFIEHKNSGWCATPPISYAEFDGTWAALSDSLLEVTVGYWGGTMTYQIRIVKLDGNQLVIRYLYGEDRAPAR
jgi:hypothetical protein